VGVGVAGCVAALASYVHGKGVKFGLYSARCKTTCQHRAASWGYQTVDAEQYAEWKVDYLSKSHNLFPSLHACSCSGA
jgi:hypothetical protein